MKELDDQNLTFKPNLNKPKTRAQMAPNTQADRGMQKYLQRVDYANKLKKEKKDLEDKVFAKGKNWTPQVTTPNAPKLTAKK